VKRVLVAGFGNVLRGDDGFGIAVIRRLEREPLPDRVRLLEVGTGGIHLAQELLSTYDHLIVVDAMIRGGVPGTIYTLQVDDVAAATMVDLHAAVPGRALAIAKALGGLPARVHMIGCEPVGTDELMADFSEPVRAAIEPAVRAVLRLVDLEAAA
jgi:hydrogenase maturation protease